MTFREPLFFIKPQNYIVVNDLRTDFSNSAKKLPVEEKIVVVGSGRLGSSIIRSYKGSVAGVFVRSEASARRVLAINPELRIIREATELNDLEFDTLWIAVSDSAILGIIELFSEIRIDWTGVTVVHSSGGTPLEVLLPLARRGGVTLALHPNDFFLGDRPISSGLTWTVTPTDMASRRRAAVLLAPLNAGLLPLEEGARPLYHAAASMASNHAVALFDTACQLYRAAGIPEEDARLIVGRFMTESALSAEAAGADVTLTGPVERGDWDVVQRQLDAVQSSTPEYFELYVALCRRTIDLAGRGGEEGIPKELLR